MMKEDRKALKAHVKNTFLELKKSFDEVLDLFELGMSGIFHQLKESHFYGRRNNAAGTHFQKSGLFIVLEPGTNGVC
jgi:hypothetical protein